VDGNRQERNQHPIRCTISNLDGWVELVVIGQCENRRHTFAGLLPDSHCNRAYSLKVSSNNSEVKRESIKLDLAV